LSGVAKRFGLKYSRYADDITFSSMHNVYQANSEFLKELHRVIVEQNFTIKESKTRLQKDGYCKEVTGLLVNEKVNVPQRYIKQLRMWLYYWERYGYERASGFFLKQYIADKGHVKKGKPDMKNVISGKLDYLKMVKGKDNESYKKLRIRFNSLINPNNDSNNFKNRTKQLDDILSKFFSIGIQKAMEDYNYYSFSNSYKQSTIPITNAFRDPIKVDISPKVKKIKKDNESTINDINSEIERLKKLLEEDYNEDDLFNDSEDTNINI
jgi:hypothetical protein